MNRTAVETIIRDLALPGKLVEFDRKMIRLDLLDDRTEQLHRVELTPNEFCDLVLDWRERLLARADVEARSQAPAA